MTITLFSISFYENLNTDSAMRRLLFVFLRDWTLTDLLYLVTLGESTSETITGEGHYKKIDFNPRPVIGHGELVGFFSLFLYLNCREENSGKFHLPSSVNGAKAWRGFFYKTKKTGMGK